MARIACCGVVHLVKLILDTIFYANLWDPAVIECSTICSFHTFGEHTVRFDHLKLLESSSQMISPKSGCYFSCPAALQGRVFD